MFIKLDSKKTIIKIGYSKQEVSDSQTVEKDENENNVITYNYGSGNSCVECTDEDVLARLGQLDSYVKIMFVTESIYNITWSDSKVNCEEVLDMDGKSQDPKVYVQSHFTGDDSAKDARILAEEWTNIRRERDRLLAETDWMTCSDAPTMSAANKTYRQKLRDLPSDQSSKKTFSDITWPSKP